MEIIKIKSQNFRLVLLKILKYIMNIPITMIEKKPMYREMNKNSEDSNNDDVILIKSEDNILVL